VKLPLCSPSTLIRLCLNSFALPASSLLLCLQFATAQSPTSSTMKTNHPAASTDAFFLPNDRVLFEGDSLTDGLKNNCGRLMGWDKTWAHRVDEWLFVHRPALNLECRNFAVGGSSAKTMLDRVGAAVAFKPSVAMLTIGTNDTIMHVPVETFRGQFTEWCDRLTKAGCRRIVLIGGFAPCPNVDKETRGVLERCMPYWRAGREVVEAHGGVYLDVGASMLPRAQALDKRWPDHTVYSSGVHYNALGNELIAGAVLTQLGFWKEP
jgi:lysophospholipase L1-like esterase